MPLGAQEKRGHHATASALLDVSLRPGLFAHVPYDLVPRAPFQDEMVALTCTTDPTVLLLPVDYFLIKLFILIFF